MNTKYTKLLNGIWVTAFIWSLIVASYFFFGFATEMSLPVMKFFMAISASCFLAAVVSFWLSPIYFAWRFHHRHWIGITICTILSPFLPILIPGLIFWAYLPLEKTR